MTTHTARLAAKEEFLQELVMARWKAIEVMNVSVGNIDCKTCISCNECNACQSCTDCFGCVNCYDCHGCVECYHCRNVIGLRYRRYVAYNVQYSQENYWAAFGPSGPTPPLVDVNTHYA